MAAILPTAYCNHATYAAGHASLFLEKYGNLLTWTSTEKEVVADVGCADGSITTDVLLPFCGDKIDKLFGIDISSDMLILANKRNKGAKTIFVEMDVSKQNLNSNMLEKFGHIFSFYCLHMIADQRRAAENLFKMLKPGGELFLTIMFKNTVVDSNYVLCRDEKWSAYIGGFPETISQYFTCEHPQEDFERVFKDVGFTVECFKSGPMPWYLNREQFERLVSEATVLVNSIPKDLKDEFLKESVELATKMCKSGDSYVINMETIVAVARRPLN